MKQKINQSVTSIQYIREYQMVNPLMCNYIKSDVLIQVNIGHDRSEKEVVYVVK